VKATYQVDAIQGKFLRVLAMGETFDKARAIADRAVADPAVQVRVTGTTSDGDVLVVEDWRAASERAGRVGVGHVLADGHVAETCELCLARPRVVVSDALDAGYRTLQDDVLRNVGLLKIATNEAAAESYRELAGVCAERAKAERDRLGIEALAANDACREYLDRLQDNAPAMLQFLDDFVAWTDGEVSLGKAVPSIASANVERARAIRDRIVGVKS